MNFNFVDVIHPKIKRNTFEAKVIDSDDADIFTLDIRFWEIATF